MKRRRMNSHHSEEKKRTTEKADVYHPSKEDVYHPSKEKSQRKERMLSQITVFQEKEPKYVIEERKRLSENGVIADRSVTARW